MQKRGMRLVMNRLALFHRPFVLTIGFTTDSIGKLRPIMLSDQRVALASPGPCYLLVDESKTERLIYCVEEVIDTFQGRLHPIPFGFRLR